MPFIYNLMVPTAGTTPN